MNRNKIPRLTCGAIIVSKDKKILLLKRKTEPFKDYWCLPGGHVEWQETVYKAIKREVKEETGLNFLPKPFKCYDEIFPKIDWHAFVVFFQGRVKGKIQLNEKESQNWGWFSQKEIKKLKIAFLHKKVLKDYFNYVSKNCF